MARKTLESKRSIYLKQKKQRRTSILSMLLGGVVIVMVAAFFMFARQDLEAKNRQARERNESLKRQVEAQEAIRAQLGEQKKYVQTKKYIEDVAKSKLGLLYPDELMLKPAAAD